MIEQAVFVRDLEENTKVSLQSVMANCCHHLVLSYVM